MKRVLLIAYSFYPEKTVGAIRSSYWFEEANKSEEIEFYVLTKSKPEHELSELVYGVPHKSKHPLSFLIKDQGLSWKRDIQDFFLSHAALQFDVVIFTGGPFLHFGLGSWIKKRLNCKLVYDFRDPFSDQPRFNDGVLVRNIKRWFERRMIKKADLVITVNQACHTLIAPSLKNLNRAVVPNGYDERWISKSSPTSNTSDLVHAGKFYHSTDPLLKALDSLGLRLHHAGPEKLSNALISANNYTYYGLVGQKELPQFLSTGSIGVFYLSAQPFESPTKLFDYLAYNKKILVITEGNPWEGEVANILSSYKVNVRWVVNQQLVIEKALSELLQMETLPIDVNEFSRAKALEKLLNFIEVL